MGADIRVSNVPKRLSSAKERIVKNGISAGPPKISPSASEESGGSIQSDAAKLSIKKRNPKARRDKK